MYLCGICTPASAVYREEGCPHALSTGLNMPIIWLQAVQALVRKYEEAYLESEQQGDREFWVAFYNKPQTLPLRQLKTGAIGQLTCFKVTARSLITLFTPA
jgi:DNA replicative helicase MCM subunit Mcm2 (Cdc46/Mcm family)